MLTGTQAYARHNVSCFDLKRPTLLLPQTPKAALGRRKLLLYLNNERFMAKWLRVMLFAVCRVIDTQSITMLLTLQVMVHRTTSNDRQRR
jgi:hypothetical protein